jgi:UDP-N-acetylmuramate: L-alanyl-gamma-D-glutamyl-meso-diaminopimelate ligase
MQVTNQGATLQGATPQGATPMGVVFPSGRPKNSRSEINAQLEKFRSEGFSPHLFEPELDSRDGFSAGTDMERAVLLAQALTLRKFPVLWVARGGYGSTAILPLLQDMLPPILPDKTLIGYSDASFIGNFLSTQFPNFTYVMAGHAFESGLFDSSNQIGADHSVTLSIARGITPELMTFETTFSAIPDPNRRRNTEISGTIAPINLSLAESLACLKSFHIPRGRILFLEDITEDVFRILRKIDSLVNSGFLVNTEAIVLGDFSDCPDANGVNAKPESFANLIAARTGIPTFVLPIFGHGDRRLPLVAGSRVEIKMQSNDVWSVSLRFEKVRDRGPNRRFAQIHESETQPSSDQDPRRTRVHFLGIGGTGMAAVAGIAKRAGYQVTGSDGPIYPPMSTVLEELEIQPYQGYLAENLTQANPDLIVLANAVSRVSGQLGSNAEFEALLQSHIPTMSFPGFLKSRFLSDSTNIVVAGTHGKTTTTSAISHALRELGQDPSFLIGGAPKNFAHGFHLGKKGVFILEGDEYDTALFDKGPKFLHYEPKITLINNIEFDHADIYPNLEAIVTEFRRLIDLTTARNGIVVANVSDNNVLAALTRSNCTTIGFGNAQSPAWTSQTTDLKPHSVPTETKATAPLWTYLSHTTRAAGTDIHLRAPNGETYIAQTQLFGTHNALNIVGTLAVLHAYHLLEQFPEGLKPGRVAEVAPEISPAIIERWLTALGGFLGVKRRFEMLHCKQDIAVFDDFAHHPTAIKETLSAFRDYHTATDRSGKLRVCFDPRNATMRRNVLQADLTDSLKVADHVYIGKVAQDLRIPENERMNNHQIANTLRAQGKAAESFDANDSLLNTLLREVAPGDTLVFMSSGAFDHLPYSLVEKLGSTGTGGSAS